ncbi:site-specific DNA-methyltransferase [Salegentibacter sp. Hel_I_6]|uniref:site-specific DNA-methyltransferase n=1 Tax=Salegentibacter sp. Hel_I_6 TaxID=1250278 RepID=UPI000567BEA0|nr:site-specific DNA-methyltransferase [Salegentibacter sp. Hel_I_6]
MDGTSQTPQEIKLQELKKIFPEVFAEGKVDWEKLKATLGEDINFSNERYVLNWAGKSDAFKVLQAPTTKTLIPAKDESVNFEETENIFIEGENLEVLKVLQKSYFGKVKMIYIDPPYNTGNDHFIYPDKFSETKADYEKRVGDKDEEGYMTKEGMYKKNSKENGQYHSNWLNMMYPRLFLAKNLLKQDGIIFVSIDDNEVHNLKLIMNEVFGEENFVASLIYDKNRKNDAKYFSVGHEYMLVYFKDYQIIKDQKLVFRTVKEGIDDVKEEFINLKKRHKNDWELVEKGIKDFYKSWDEDDERISLARFNKVDEKGPYRDDGNISWPGGGGPKYEILHPETKKPCKIPDGGWRFPKKKRMLEEIEKGRVVFGKDESTLPRIRRNLFETDKEVMRSVHFSYAQTATSEFNKIFNNQRIFDNPKHFDDIAKLITYVTEPNEEDLILDFFSGSATTAHAVMKSNKEDGGNRKYICVQLPEETDTKSNAYKAGFKNISEISKERIRRVGDIIRNELKQENERKKLEIQFQEDSRNYKIDLGFKVLKLSDSNFKQWQQIQNKDAKALEEQIKLFVDPVSETATIENMVYELLLKSGKDLNSKIVNQGDYYTINEDELALLLEKANQEIINKIIASKPQKVIALDKLFKDNDQLKTNTVLQLKDAGIEFKTI